MENNWNQLIERYLNNELSAEGREAFAAELAKNKSLQQELELHQLTQDVVRRTAMRNLVVKRGKFLKVKKILTNAGIGIVIATIIASAVLYFNHSKSNHVETTTETIDKALLDKMEKELGFDRLDVQYFKFTGENDVFLSETGVLLSITDNSFLLNGKPYHGEAVVQWQEAQTAAEIVKAGLSTTSGDKLLETQGMFSLNAFTPDGKQLELSNTGIYVQVPVTEQKEGMMLFNGVKGNNGSIDWQNPQQMEKLPIPKSMAEMDLFPPKYEPKLNELKWFTDKAKRDSLYLSFEENVLTANPAWGHGTQLDSAASENNSNKSKSVPANLTEWGTSISLEAIKASNLPISKFGSYPLIETFSDNLNDNSVDVIATLLSDKEPTPQDTLEILTSPDYQKNGAMIVSTIPSSRLMNNGTIVIEYETTYYQNIKGTKDEFEVNGIIHSFNTSEKVNWSISKTYNVPMNDAQVEKTKPHIPPSKVLAIWNKKFDNTILATVDFEKRMKAIHTTCDERVFDIYVKGINEPLWKLDEKVVKLGYPEFQQFADEHVGKLDISNEHQQNLNAFYDQAIKNIRAKGKTAMLSALKKEKQWDDEMNKERSNEMIRKGLRESTNLSEEYDFNLKNVYKQLGKTAGFQMHGGGTIVNIDKYVMDATIARKSTTITDPETGKTAQIVYNSLTASVDDHKQYDKLFFYLFSKEMNSYQRIDFNDGKLDYSLNGDMNYKAVAVGLNDQGYFLYEIRSLEAGDLGQLKLEEVSEAEFDKRINAMNSGRTVNPMEIQSELNWLFKEKANYKVQKQRRENAAFRATIRKTIYNCREADLTESVHFQ